MGSQDITNSYKPDSKCCVYISFKQPLKVKKKTNLYHFYYHVSRSSFTTKFINWWQSSWFLHYYTAVFNPQWNNPSGLLVQAFEEKFANLNTWKLNSHSSFRSYVHQNVSGLKIDSEIICQSYNICIVLNILLRMHVVA